MSPQRQRTGSGGESATVAPSTRVTMGSLAEELGVSRRTAFRRLALARELNDHPDLAEKADSGAMSWAAASREAKRRKGLPVPSESAATKARRYLSEGRLTIWSVAQDEVRARCRGQGELYELGLDYEEGWWCTCAAGTRCSHLIALQLVVTEG